MSFSQFKKLEPESPAISSHVGVSLRARRRLMGLTLDQVATRAGCSESMLCKIETGKVNPSITLLRRLAEALSINIAALFEDSAPPDVVQRAGERPRLNDPLAGVKQVEERRNVGDFNAGILWVNTPPTF